MSSRNYRRATASALLAGCLGLLPLTAEAAPAPRQARAVRVAVANPSLFSSFWSQLVSLWAGDHGNTGDTGNHEGSSHPPRADEGPGMCPHGHHG